MNSGMPHGRVAPATHDAGWTFRVTFSNSAAFSPGAAVARAAMPLSVLRPR